MADERDLTDRELVTRLQRGDADAFTDLIAEHDAALRRTAMTFVSTRASADEVVQDTWVAVLAGVASFEGRSSIKTWIFQILQNRARTRGAREARSVPVSAMCDPSHAEASGPDLAEAVAVVGPAQLERLDEATPTQLLLRKELVRALDAAMRDLPERQRTVVILRDALGWSPQDVCAAMSVNEINQRVLLHRGRCRLRASLEQFRAAG